MKTLACWMAGLFFLTGIAHASPNVTELTDRNFGFTVRVITPEHIVVGESFRIRVLVRPTEGTGAKKYSFRLDAPHKLTMKSDYDIRFTSDVHGLGVQSEPNLLFFHFDGIAREDGELDFDLMSRIFVDSPQTTTIRKNTLNVSINVEPATNTELVIGKGIQDIPVAGWLNTPEFLSLAKPNGRVRLVFICEHWSEQCSRATAVVKELYGKYPAKDFEVLHYLLHADLKQDAKMYVEEKQIHWPVSHGGYNFPRPYKPEELVYPQFYVLSPSGALLWKHFGLGDQIFSELKSSLQTAIARK